jgi:hypothetical protein
MWHFTEIADWFDGNRVRSDSILDEWVEGSNYNQGVMVVAASTKALMTFGAGFVDLLRLGDGIKGGTLAGVGTDALRVLAVLPVGRAANLLKSAKGISVAKLILDTGGPNCFWVASAKAFGQIRQKYGGRLLASVEDVAKALGMSMENLWTIPNLATGISYLQRLGAKFGPIKTVANLRDVTQMVPYDGSVVMIAVRVMKAGKVVGGHAIYAFRNTLGQIRFMDRTVGTSTAGGARGAFSSLDEIAPMYGATALVPYEAAVLYNIYVKSVVFELPRLVIPILGVVATEDAQ